jgi:hypothetical protein
MTSAALSWESERPANLYISKSNVTSEIVKIKFKVISPSTVFLENEKREVICKGTFTPPPKVSFTDFDCLDGKFKIKGFDLKEINLPGVMSHMYAVSEASNGDLIGIILHSGNQNAEYSSFTVPDEKIKEIYGDFPNWNPPKK